MAEAAQRWKLWCALRGKQPQQVLEGDFAAFTNIWVRKQPQRARKPHACGPQLGGSSQAGPPEHADLQAAARFALRSRLEKVLKMAEMASHRSCWDAS